MWERDKQVYKWWDKIILLRSTNDHKVGQGTQKYSQCEYIFITQIKIELL